MADFTRSEAKSWANKTIRGFYSAPITPITDNKIDEAKLRENIDTYIDWGVDGLVVGGFAAETWNMQPEEWFRYHDIVADAVAGRTDLWSIILDPSADFCLRKLDHIEKLGYSGAEVMNPMTQLRTDSEIFDFFKYITDASNLAVCLYRTPVSGKVLSLDLMKRLVDLETVVCVKQGHLNRSESLLLRRELRDDFIVSDPIEQFFVDDLRLGGQVLFAEFSYLLYGKKREVLRSYYEDALAGRWDDAWAKWHSLRPIWEIYEDEFMGPLGKTAAYARLIGVIKVWCEFLGLHAGPVTAPVQALTGEERDRLIGKLQKVDIV
ncbi:MAG: dihydrodipicolinate synthase family protein [Immundisolibacteraceae bacterium]|nr:dihydrodipicolinate synthase family protein [Immundisolibacteraceae bacterium]